MIINGGKIGTIMSIKNRKYLHLWILGFENGPQISRCKGKEKMIYCYLKGKNLFFLEA